MTAKQIPLSIWHDDPQELLSTAIDKIKAADILSHTEMKALKHALDGKLFIPVRIMPNFQLVVDCWFKSFEEENGKKPPKPTNVEFQMLKNATKRVGGAEAACELIPAFWEFRRSADWLKMIDPTPAGFSKHLARIQEFHAKQLKIKQKQEAQQIHREQPDKSKTVSTEQVRSFVQTLAAGKAY